MTPGEAKKRGAGLENKETLLGDSPLAPCRQTTLIYSLDVGHVAKIWEQSFGKQSQETFMELTETLLTSSQQSGIFIPS